MNSSTRVPPHPTTVTRPTSCSTLLHTSWQHLNAQFFQSTLDPIAIVWSSRLTASVGMFVSRAGPRARVAPGQASSPTRRQIRLSAPLLRDQPERELLRTLAHEMIHQWQHDVLKRRPNHGPDFRRMMDTMNRAGLGITVHHALGEAVHALTKYAWHCQQCGEVYERQRRTIKPRVHRCGSCRGPLRELGRNSARQPSPERTGGLPRVQLTLPFEIP